MDDRGQTIGIARAFLFLAVAAFMIGLFFDRAGLGVIQSSQAAADNATAQQAAQWSSDFVGLLPLAALLIAMLSVIVIAILQRERIR